jgi:hypothetical protein
MKTLAGMILGAGLAMAASQTVTGVVTDTMCGANHKAMNVTPDSKCVRDCVKMGAKYALVAGGKVYTFTEQTAPAKFAGERVKATGTLDEKAGTVKAERIEAAK